MMDYLFFPRLHTAFAEWLGCMLFLYGVPKRLGRIPTALGCAGFGVLLVALNMASQNAGGMRWLTLMAACMLCMLGMIFACCKLSFYEALYQWSFAFIVAEFAASFEWLINFYLLQDGYLHGFAQTFITMWLFYLVIFGAMAAINRRRNRARQKITVTPWETLSVVLIAVFTFALSNLNFVVAGSLFSRTQGAGVLYTRTLVDIGGLLVLLVWEEGRRELNLRYELAATENLFNRQWEQYKQYEANNEELHRIYHDLKHQIAYLESEEDVGKRVAYLAEMKQTIEIREAMVRTNSSVLDTLLTSKNALCLGQGIVMRCYADAGCIAFINTMDLCAIFGNAIDNAIEYEMRLSDPDKRLITVDVYRENNFAVIRIANYCEASVAFENGLPVTTKKDKRTHGFGVKSIRQIVHKYHGHLNIGLEDNWFVLMILLPIYEKEE